MEKEVYRLRKTTYDEEVYEIAKFKGDYGYRIYIRKYGERRGVNIYLEDEYELEKFYLDALIENRKLRLKLRDAKRALR